MAVFSSFSGGTEVTGQGPCRIPAIHAAEPTRIVTQALVQVMPGPPKTLSIDD
ncbi:MAG: hypothetical protein QF598_08200 [Arenicellales bacterium]|nr:hypothetical protein [Arenicellales bacterium]